VRADEGLLDRAAEYHLRPGAHSESPLMRDYSRTGFVLRSEIPEGTFIGNYREPVQEYNPDKQNLL